MKAGIATGLTLILGVVLGVILSGQGHLESAEPQLVVTARHLPKAPAGPDDPAWQQAQPVDVHVRGRDSFAGEEVTVITRAAYTDDRLYFLFKWKDPTESVVKQAWKFDGQKWAHMQGDEDRHRAALRDHPDQRVRHQRLCRGLPQPPGCSQQGVEIRHADRGREGGPVALEGGPLQP